MCNWLVIVDLDMLKVLKRCKNYITSVIYLSIRMFTIL